MPALPTQPVFADFSSVGLTDQVFASLLISTSADGPTGTFIPTQYFNTQGTESATGGFVTIPYGFWLTATLTWVNGISGASIVNSSSVEILQNGISVASTFYSGLYAGPIGVTLPGPVDGANLQIISTLSGTGSTGIFWNTLAEPWNTTEVYWNS